MAQKKRALTGIKPTEAPHVGNYLGMIRPALDLAGTCEAFYFVASYHALTTLHDRERMRDYVLDVAATWLALGLDPASTVLFAQHDVPEVCELAWVLGCVTGTGMLERAHAYKDAVAKGREVNAGLFNYPVLMAADILIFDSDVVPVGQDQKQHVEMARDIAMRFNNAFGETLKVPEPLIRGSVATVPGIDGQKMSKSHGNQVGLFLPPDRLRERIMAIVTDSTPLHAPKDPESCNVFAIYRLVAPQEQVEDLARRYRAGGLGYGHAKQELFEVLDALMREPRERYQELRARPELIREVLADGAGRARATARATVARVRDRIGL